MSIQPLKPRIFLLAGLIGLAAAMGWLLPKLARPPGPFDVAMDLLANGRAEDAVYLFDDTTWRGVAEYRAGRYRRAINEFFQTENVITLYNLGNAYAQLHEWAGAKAAYRRVLRLNPGHADARFNLELVTQAEQLEQQLLAQERGERSLGRWRDGDRDQRHPGSGESDQIERGDARDGAKQAATQPTVKGGRSDRPGMLGDRAMSDQAQAGSAQAAAVAAPEVEGRSGAHTAAARRESAQAAEILLHEIRDDPARVLAARLYAVHRQRQKSESP